MELFTMIVVALKIGFGMAAFFYVAEIIAIHKNWR